MIQLLSVFLIVGVAVSLVHLLIFYMTPKDEEDVPCQLHEWSLNYDDELVCAVCGVNSRNF